MTIAEVSSKYGITKDTLRYYEKIGLLTDVPRSPSKIRSYDKKTCRQIEFIKCMRDAGVEIDVLTPMCVIIMVVYKTIHTTIMI